MDFGQAKRRPPTEINLTALIDIVFQLLIFFLLTATFVQTPGIEVELPRADSALPIGEQDQPMIAIDFDGQVFFEGRMVSLDELRDGLGLIKADEDADQQITIFADDKAPHGRVVGVLDVVTELGFARPMIATGGR